MRTHFAATTSSLLQLSLAILVATAGVLATSSVAQAQPAASAAATRRIEPYQRGRLVLDWRLGARWCRASDLGNICDGKPGSMLYGPQLGMSGSLAPLPWLTVGVLAAGAQLPVSAGVIAHRADTRAGGASWQVMAFAAVHPVQRGRFDPRLELGVGYVGEWVRTHFDGQSRELRSQAWSHRAAIHIGLAAGLFITDTWSFAPRVDFQPLLPGRLCQETTYVEKTCRATGDDTVGINADTAPTRLGQQRADASVPVWVHIGIDVRKHF